MAIPYTTLTRLDDAPDILRKQGFVIIEDYKLPQETCETALTEVWEALESIISIDRKDKNTYNKYFDLQPLHSMLLQHYGFSQLPTVWHSREHAAPIFAKLWNVDVNDLITSMDGISFHIPPELFTSNRGRYRDNSWFHTDQSYLKEGGCCIQGFWNMLDCSENDACLSVLSESHKYQTAFKEKFLLHKDKKDIVGDWYKLHDEEISFYKEKCQWYHVCPPQGAFVIWDSRTIHCGTEPRLPRNHPTFRLIHYVCMLPRFQIHTDEYSCNGITETDKKKRIKAFEEGRSLTHWPYKPKLFSKYPRVYGGKSTLKVQIKKSMKLEDMTLLQKRLLGYDS